MKRMFQPWHLLVTILAGWGAVVGQIECRERLGGMLRYYYRTAA